MNVLMRVDASRKIGSGHMMRCLTIAEQLRERSCSVSFYMKNTPSHFTNYVKKRDFQVVTKFIPVDICIIDHYDIDFTWENSIRPYVKKIIVMDDLANRQHDCDVLLDQNIVANYQSRYDGLVPEGCKKLLGPEYLIVREEFLKERLKVRERTGEVERTLVFMGGTDPTDETVKVLNAFQTCKHLSMKVDVVVGNGNSQKEKVKEICEGEGFNYFCQIDHMATLMRQADFSIGAGGSTMWERCFLGLPSTSTIVAPNQIEATIETEKLGVVWNLGWHEEVTVQTYVDVIQNLSEKTSELRSMSAKGLELTKNVKDNLWIDVFLEGLT